MEVIIPPAAYAPHANRHRRSSSVFTACSGSPTPHDDVKTDDTRTQLEFPWELTAADYARRLGALTLLAFRPHYAALLEQGAVVPAQGFAPEVGLGPAAPAATPPRAGASSPLPDFLLQTAPRPLEPGELQPTDMLLHVATHPRFYARRLGCSAEVLSASLQPLLARNCRLLQPPLPPASCLSASELAVAFDATLALASLPNMPMHLRDNALALQAQFNEHEASKHGRQGSRRRLAKRRTSGVSISSSASSASFTSSQDGAGSSRTPRNAVMSVPDRATPASSIDDPFPFRAKSPPFPLFGEEEEEEEETWGKNACLHHNSRATDEADGRTSGSVTTGSRIPTPNDALWQPLSSSVRRTAPAGDTFHPAVPLQAQSWIAADRGCAVWSNVLDDSIPPSGDFSGTETADVCHPTMPSQPRARSGRGQDQSPSPQSPGTGREPAPLTRSSSSIIVAATATASATSIGADASSRDLYLSPVSDVCSSGGASLSASREGSGRAIHSTLSLPDRVAATQAAAKRGEAEAQFRLAELHARGAGVPMNTVAAATWYARAAAQDHAGACAALGEAHARGRGVPLDAVAAVIYFRRAAAQGHVPAAANLGLCLLHGLGVMRDAEAAVQHLKSAAARGQAAAQTNLGVCYAAGRGGLRADPAKAVALFRQAAAAGDADGQSNLGLCLASGRGCQQDQQAAARWLAAAAAQGHAAALNSLGLMCASGSAGMPQNLVQAAVYYQRAADKDDARGLCNLGRCYAAGRGLERDSTKALLCFRRAAERGDATGMALLANCLEKGRSLPANVMEAGAWYRRAALRGHVEAMLRLACLYERGLLREVGSSQVREMAALDAASDAGVEYAAADGEDGDEAGCSAGVDEPAVDLVEVDRAAAVVWYHKAAVLGNVRAMVALAQYYRRGWAVSRDDRQALAWLKMASGRGCDEAALELGRCYEAGIGTPRDPQAALDAYTRVIESSGEEANTALRLYEQLKATTTVLTDREVPEMMMV